MEMAGSVASTGRQSRKNSRRTRKGFRPAGIPQGAQLRAGRCLHPPGDANAIVGHPGALAAAADVIATVAISDSAASCVVGLPHPPRQRRGNPKRPHPDLI